MTATVEQADPILLEIDAPERFKKVEIIGRNVIMSPPRFIHNTTLHRLMTQLDQQLSADWLYGSDVLTPFEPGIHEFCPDGDRAQG
jgi:hypothetical protein